MKKLDRCILPFGVTRQLFWRDQCLARSSLKDPKRSSLKPTRNCSLGDTMMRARLRYSAFNPATQLKFRRSPRVSVPRS